MPHDLQAQSQPQTSSKLATLFDLSRCIGCGSCVSACKEQNAAKYPKLSDEIPAPYPSKTPIEDYSKRQDVENRLTPYNWLTIESVEIQTAAGRRDIHIPRRCMHCEKPPCQALCPFGAISNTETGSVAIDPNLCFGGAKCRDICPWGIPQRQSGVGLYMKLMPRFAGNGVMFKCDRCPQRLAKGELPACIEACPQDVQKIGPKEDIIRQAHALAAESGGEIYGLSENGGTLTIYVSPVPLEQLRRHLVPGPGKPGLPDAQSPLATPEVLAGSVLIAPIAGSIRRMSQVVKVAQALKSRVPQAASGVAHPAPAAQTDAAAPLPHSKRRPRLVGMSLAAALLSGLLQMPLAKRYWLASTPGFTWTGSPKIAAAVHLAAATILLFTIFRSAKPIHQVMVGLVALTGMARPLAASLGIFMTQPWSAFFAFAHLGLLAMWLVLTVALAMRQTKNASVAT